MTQLFIADLHLSEQRPDLTQALCRFLHQQAREAEALYILGDLFEFWIGDDEDSALQREVSAAFRALAAAGVKLYYQHGNRDFMLGRQFARDAHLEYLPEEYVIDLAGHRTLLMHGDLLCTLDVEFQRFRRITHWPWLQWLFLRLPLSRRLALAEKMRQGKKGKSLYLMDVTQDAVCTALQRHQATRLIHGHTHQPGRHTFTLPNGQMAERLVMSDWETRFTYLEADDHGIELKTQTINPPA